MKRARRRKVHACALDHLGRTSPSQTATPTLTPHTSATAFQSGNRSFLLQKRNVQRIALNIASELALALDLYKLLKRFQANHWAALAEAIDSVSRSLLLENEITV